MTKNPEVIGGDGGEERAVGKERSGWSISYGYEESVLICESPALLKKYLQQLDTDISYGPLGKSESGKAAYYLSIDSAEKRASVAPEAKPPLSKVSWLYESSRQTEQGQEFDLRPVADILMKVGVLADVTGADLVKYFRQIGEYGHFEVQTSDPNLLLQFSTTKFDFGRRYEQLMMTKEDSMVATGDLGDHLLLGGAPEGTTLRMSVVRNGHVISGSGLRYGYPFYPTSQQELVSSWSKQIMRYT